MSLNEREWWAIATTSASNLGHCVRHAVESDSRDLNQHVLLLQVVTEIEPEPRELQNGILLPQTSLLQLLLRLND